MKMKIQGVGIALMQNPVFLRSFWLACFQNPVFLQLFWPDSASPWPSGLPPGLQIFWNERKHIGFWKHAQQNARKNSGFCNGESPRFFPHILVAKKNPHALSWFICLPEGPPGAPPQLAHKIVHFVLKTVLARSHFRKADQIEIPGMFESSEVVETS